MLSFFVSVLAVLYVWHVTNKMKSVKHLDLSQSTDKVVEPWLKKNVTTWSLETDEKKVAAKYLEKVHNLTVDPKTVIFGKDLLVKVPTLERVFYVRDSFGIDLEIAVASGVKTDDIDFNWQFFNSVLDSESCGRVLEFLTSLLKKRWEMIKALQDPRVLNESGSFLFLKTKDTEIFNNSVLASATPFGARINLLCNDFEFDMLMKRWKASLEAVVDTNHNYHNYQYKEKSTTEWLVQE